MPRTIPLVLAANRLGIGYPVVYRLMFTKCLIGERIRGRWFVTEESVEALEREILAKQDPVEA